MIRGSGPALSRSFRRPSAEPSPLALALGPPRRDPLPASIVGLEHEYSLHAGGERLDFRNLIHDLPIPGRRLDPGDLNAYRGPSGLVITCDAEDAEVVSPPLAVRPGFGIEVAAWAEHGRAELSRLLPTGIAVQPFSTHLSASMPADIVDSACALFARTFAPALMLMLDGPDSHGVFVRPRPGRLEVCGEHAMGARLTGAAALVAGGATACAAAVSGGLHGAGHLPPLLSVDVRPATGRRGLFVGRTVAFGYDLYAVGRGAVLPLDGGGEIGAQEHLVLAWEAARAALGGHAGPADLGPGDAMVFGSEPLGVEGPDDGGVTQPWLPPLRPSPFGDVLRPRHRPGFETTPVAATWDFTVLRLRGAARQAYACVPGAQLGQFLEGLDAGRLDDLLNGFLDADPSGRVLSSHDETRDAGLWDDAVVGPDLLAYERSAADGDGDGAELALLPHGWVGTTEQTPPLSYVRRGKAAFAAAPPIPLSFLPISAAGPVTGAPGPPAPGSMPPPPEQPRAPAPVPAGRPRRRRRRAGVLAGAFLVLLLAGGAAAMTGWFAGRGPAGVDILTSPAPPSPPTGVAVGDAVTTNPTEPTSTAEPETTAVPSDASANSAPAVGPAGPGTAVGTVPTVPPPTTAVTVEATTVTTVPRATTVPVGTTVQPTTTAAPTTTTEPPTTTTVATTTTVTVPPPTSFVVAVASSTLGCAFQPSSASAAAGSTVRFRNDTPAGVSVSIAPPAGPITTMTLDAGGTSSGYSLAVGGSYAVSCTPGGDVLPGRMTITATNP